MGASAAEQRLGATPGAAMVSDTRPGENQHPQPPGPTAQRLAKLSRPRLHAAVARERLFARLDEAQGRRPLIWIVGPPGAGKTTLAATYLDSRKILGIWYQVDRGDADPATFFYYLGQAGLVLNPDASRPPLPLLTPEFLLDLPGFTRRYFRELLSRMNAPGALVLDNFQDLPDDSALHPALAEGFEEIPEAITVWLISRVPQPPAYSRLQANNAVANIDWEQLKLTREETEALARSEAELDAAQIERLHRLAGGWAAGLRLLTERLRGAADLEDIQAPDSLEQVFNYFAAQIFDQASLENQQLLLQAGLLPRMTAPTLEALTGNANAGRLLDHLYRRHLFTDRRKAEPPVYQFHALFRAFLHHRAQATYPAERLRLDAHRAAGLLEEQGQVDDAFELYRQAQDWEATVRLALAQAGSLLAQGRWKQLVEWIESLPAERAAGDAWLLYWLGAARIPVDPQRARADLERAYTRAVELQDEDCELQAAAGMVEAYMLQYTTYRPLDPWISVLEKALDARRRFPTADAELRVLSALLIALAYRDPLHPKMAACVERVFELLPSATALSVRFTAALNLTLYGGVSGPSAVADRAAPIVRALADHPEISALNAAFCWFVLSFYHLLNYRSTECEHAIAQVIKVADDHGLPFVRRFAAIIGAWLELARGDLAAAEAWIAELEKVVVPTQLYDVASLQWLKAHAAVARGHADLAFKHGDEAVRVFDQAGTYFHRVTARYDPVWGAVLRGDYATARTWIADARKIAGEGSHCYALRAFHAAEAWIALETGDAAAATEALKRAFGPASQSYDKFAFGLFRFCAPRLAAEALARGIEVDRVRRLIRDLGLAAPSPQPAAWPWPMRVYALGRFEVLLDDQPLKFNAKHPRKSLALLKALISLGGQAVPDYRLIDALWPDEEGDAARAAFTQALHRLRRLLGEVEAIEVREGRLSIHQQVCWVDAFAFERQAQSAGAVDLDQNLALYRGAFLPGDMEEPWTVATRERLRAKFARRVAERAACVEASGKWQEAADLYQRGLDADPLAEGFYQGLMRCYAAMDQRAEALSVFQRLRQILSVSLGIAPSQESQRLYESLKA